MNGRSLSFIFVLAAFSICFSADYNVRDFGAVDDGKTVNTNAIQQAIDVCSKAGGGKVIICGKKFLSGTLTLKDNVTLRICSGATLEASGDIKDFISRLPETDTFTNISKSYSNKALIYAEGKENIGIEGTGTINGRGDLLKGAASERPYMIFFSECKKVRVEDVKLVTSAFWLQHFLKCENVLIRGLTIRSRDQYNNDGMDINSCENVRISDCDVNCKDDCIVMKSTSDKVCRNVTITNCVLSSICNAIKCGTESNGGFENITI